MTEPKITHRQAWDATCTIRMTIGSTPGIECLARYILQQEAADQPAATGAPSLRGFCGCGECEPVDQPAATRPHANCDPRDCAFAVSECMRAEISPQGAPPTVGEMAEMLTTGRAPQGALDEAVALDAAGKAIAERVRADYAAVIAATETRPKMGRCGVWACEDCADEDAAEQASHGAAPYCATYGHVFGADERCGYCRKTASEVTK